jgi:phosphomannomutase
MAICQARKLPETHLESVTEKGDRSRWILSYAQVNGCWGQVTQMNDKTVVTLKRSIFREYDIRGQAIKVSDADELTLTPGIVKAIGQAIGSRFALESRALVTGDNRVSTPALKRALAEGLRDAELSVCLATQEMPTGATSWLALTSEFATVIQVTGSHTPPQFNGLKITERQKDGTPTSEVDATPIALYGDHLARLYEDIMANRLRTQPSFGSIQELGGFVEKYQAALVTAAKSSACFLTCMTLSLPFRVTSGGIPAAKWPD